MTADASEAIAYTISGHRGVSAIYGELKCVLTLSSKKMFSQIGFCDTKPIQFDNFDHSTMITVYFVFLSQCLFMGLECLI